MNFDPNKFKKLLNSASNPSNPKDTKIKNYYVNQEYQEFVAFNIDFENVDIALRIAGLLGKRASKFDITSFLFPETNKIDYIQFTVFEINDPELLKFLDEI
ncbi:hypothetical protein P4284_23990 [Bacillus swezeyi]|uniref:hypothetical protein n=1 Tax=Bacillus swezeyi TaxID=1925020 RepID=UPI002E23C473|nr:hypothetical protein [Bacillus swezeyi]MED2979715.1 hypothetical protein [Bacillus swezeyi]